MDRNESRSGGVGYIAIAAPPDDVNAQALAEALRGDGRIVILTSDVTSISHANTRVAVVVLISASTIYAPAVVTAVTAKPRCLIPVLIGSISLPPGPWTTRVIRVNDSV